MNIEKMRTWLKLYGIKNILFRAINEKSPLLWVSNNNLFRRMNWQLKVKKRIAKYIVYPEYKELKDNKHTKKIWWLWFQGSENAPLIVQKCLDTVKYYSAQMNLEVIELDERNLFEYVKLPNQIINMWKQKRITNANFSDLCRIALLADYGGLWIDSTVFLTGKINKEILQSDIFFYQASFLDMTVTKVSSWFMYAKNPDNYFMQSLKESMINYWINNKYVDDYFIFHIMTAAMSEKECFRKYFENMPYFSNTYPHLLSLELNNEMNKEKLRHILQMSNVHKLTYKNLMPSSDNKNVYEYIVSRKGGESLL
jgi:hypothetical protein